MSAQARPDERLPDAYTDALWSSDPPFITAFCPACKAQVLGCDSFEVANDLLVHVAETHQ